MMKAVIKRRQQLEKEERIKRILNAARRLFLKKGYLGATVRDIAFEAEMSTGVIYFYFKGKDEIYGKICEEAFHVLLDLLIKSDSKEETPLARLESLARAYIKFYNDFPEYYDILTFRDLGFKKVGLSEAVLKRLELLSSKALSILNNAVMDGIERGYINYSGDSWELTFSLWSGIEGLIFIHKRKYLENFNLDINTLLDLQIKIISAVINTK